MAPPQLTCSYFPFLPLLGVMGTLQVFMFTSFTFHMLWITPLIDLGDLYLYPPRALSHFLKFLYFSFLKLLLSSLPIL